MRVGDGGKSIANCCGFLLTIAGLDIAVMERSLPNIFLFCI